MDNELEKKAREAKWSGEVQAFPLAKVGDQSRAGWVPLQVVYDAQPIWASTGVGNNIQPVPSATSAYVLMKLDAESSAARTASGLEEASRLLNEVRSQHQLLLRANETMESSLRNTTAAFAKTQLALKKTEDSWKEDRARLAQQLTRQERDLVRLRNHFGPDRVDSVLAVMDLDEMSKERT